MSEAKPPPKMAPRPLWETPDPALLWHTFSTKSTHVGSWQLLQWVYAPHGKSWTGNSTTAGAWNNISKVENQELWRDLWLRHIGVASSNCDFLVRLFTVTSGWISCLKWIVYFFYIFSSGQPIPRVEYSPDEVECWGTVYRSLVSLFPTHACDIHIRNFRLLERECGYSADKIVQLEDVSNFLKSTYRYLVFFFFKHCLIFKTILKFKI